MFQPFPDTHGSTHALVQSVEILPDVLHQLGSKPKLPSFLARRTSVLPFILCPYDVLYSTTAVSIDVVEYTLKDI